MALARTLKPEVASRKVKLTYLRGESAVNAKGQKVLGPKREAELKRALKNYDRRTKAKIKKYYGEVTVETVAKYSRMMGQHTVIVSLDRGQIKTVRAYNTMMKFLNRDKTKAFKAELATERRNWLIKTLENAYDMDRSQFPELFAAVEKMSADQILAWATSHPDMVKKLFYHYEEVWDAETADKWASIVNGLIDTIEPYTGTTIPRVVA